MAGKIRIRIKDAKSLRFSSNLMMMVGLFCCSVWLLGFSMLVGFGSRQSGRHQEQRSCLDGEKMGRITIFSAPKPFLVSANNGVDLVGDRQELAVRSWLALSPDVAVVLFGRHASIFAFAAKLGPRVSVESAIDFTNELVLNFQEFVVQKQEYRNNTERLLIAWNTGDMPLHAGVLPPFLYRKGLHNEWLLNEVLSSEFRFPVDASNVISSFILKYWDNGLMNI
ncbi:hypothetical protein J5N97_020409 [Dioscorea zingiberensis]|uniref:Uncharacterized protein n=1 Tax=Dioscorea zingiberensis TaxID=325984 RepID=A0A9D5HDM4_9LILI|nr:hypothetical protein J5N97_020409 [Dioscorea zingiberensis]